MAAGLTQAALADGIVSTPYVSLIESGERLPRRAIIEQFADRLGVQLDELLHTSQETYWARVGLAQAIAESRLSQDPPAHVSAGGLKKSVWSGDEVLARATIRTEALACLRAGNLPQARALLEWLRGQEDSEDLDLEVLAALCRCYLDLGMVQAAVVVGREAHDRIVELRAVQLPEATEALYWLHRALLAAGDTAASRRVAKAALAAEAAGAGGDLLAQILLDMSAEQARHDDPANAAFLAERAVTVLGLVHQRALFEELRSGRPNDESPAGLVSDLDSPDGRFSVSDTVE